MIAWYLWTFHCNQGKERHHSVSTSISSLWSIMTGLIMICSAMHFPIILFFLSVFHWLTAIIRMLCHICGEANQTPWYTCINIRRLRANCLRSLSISHTGLETVLKIGWFSPTISGYCCLRVDIDRTRYKIWEIWWYWWCYNMVLWLWWSCNSRNRQKPRMGIEPITSPLPWVRSTEWTIAALNYYFILRYHNEI